MMTRIFLTALTLVGALLGAQADAQTFTVDGAFLYQDKEFAYTGWTGTDPILPIRRADVVVLDDTTGAVLGSGSTAQDGSFSIVCTGTGSLDVVVRCDCDTDLDGSFQRIRVTTESNTEYSTFSPVFAAHDTANDLNVGTSVAGVITQGSNEANPFNMLDMGVHVMEYITGPTLNEGNMNQTLRIYWPSGSGSFATNNQAHMADDDGFDDPVILHEIGHVVHNKYSESDSPGGTHFIGDSDQDPRLSFGEGFATFFAGKIQEHLGREAVYTDLSGSAQTGGVQIRLRHENAQPFGTDAFGAADESAVAVVLYDLIDDVDSVDTTPGFDDDGIGLGTSIGGLDPANAWWDVFRGPVATAGNVTMNHAWDGWFSEHVADPHFAEVLGLFEARRMYFSNDVDEPNDTLATATPTAVQTGSNWSSPRSLFASSPGTFAPGTDDEDWYSYELVKGSDLLFRTRYENAVGDADTQADVFLELYGPTGALLASDDDSGSGRNPFVDDFIIPETGTYTLRLRTLSNQRRYGTYEFRAKHNFENFVPEVSSVVASPATILDTGSSTLTATATDANAGQTLSYAWTPTNGGAIVGAGSSVLFDPPLVGASTTFVVELIVSDDLGAESASESVMIDVDPAGGSVCTGAASAASGGVGKAGSLGIPSLTATNLPVVPSSDFALTVSGALPSFSGILFFGLSQIAVPFDGGTFYPSPDIQIPFATDPAGEFVLPIVIPNDPTFCGIPLTVQAMLPNDPGAIGGKQTAQTGFVEFTFGN